MMKFFLRVACLSVFALLPITVMAQNAAPAAAQLPPVSLPIAQTKTAAPQAAEAAAPIAQNPATPLPTVAAPEVQSSRNAGMRDLSPWSMFMSADILVKAVMVSLAFASLVTWTIFLGKSVQLFIARRRVNGELARIAQTRTLSEAQLAFGKSGNVVATLLSAAITELRMSTDTLAEDGIRERAESRFTEILRAEGRVARIGMGLL